MPSSSFNSGFNYNNLNHLLNQYGSLIKKKQKGDKNHYKRSTHPTSVPLNKLFSNNFPLSIKESLEDYSYRNNPLKFQHDLLSVLPFYPEADALGRTSDVLQTVIDDQGNYINEFVIYPPGKSEADSASMNHLIMVHGYGGGLGFFLKNFDAISTLDNWCIHAIDLFGYGCSSRPPFKLAKEDLDHVDKWFHDSYETWLDKRNLNRSSTSGKTLVMAHSMGAYILGSYGIKRDPNFCDKLLMVSPGAVLKHRKAVAVPKYFAKLWEQNISPFTLVRKAGPLGSKVVSGWSHRRFAKLPQVEATLLHKYAYGIFQGPGSGEYMLNYLLAPGADARHPLIERGIHKLNCKLSWWYGKEDWMDKQGGKLCSDIINSYHGEIRSDVVEIEDSGHHLYLDNYQKFNEILVQEMKELESSC
ncbi:alpha/beta-hydrolase [Suhomyces tanzawaensis NRRL Y-17324]|uniref:Alpha/beta-hydrolase n=1 Tax=Suhomyces tanzawaensis NRRL Y-17324 TaxID=984487 RepID=A0A1E4SHB9_9ASCO|nr:alpha/beta-hydrolase [Suhomyces tanzawaensis NRRL Y-17324]ODV78904.1 alpha/beta-hydrolase [Suhomyces tanzawaensis NRRL Y-17324]